ncbi:MAG: folate family ECF transporter S component [Firmicutes bacterium]|nr:folate family ECF transporter S component [Bacillota bacterium]
MKSNPLTSLREFFASQPQIYKDSAREFTRLTSIAGVGMVLAVSIVLSFFSFYVTETLRIGPAYLATAMLGMLYGPVTGGIAAGLGDILKYLIKPSGPFFPGYTLTALLGGVVYGSFLYKNKVTVLRCVLSKAFINIFLNLGLNTLWSSILYGKAFFAILIPRVYANVALLPLQIVLLYALLKAISVLLPRIQRRNGQRAG